MYDAVNLNVSGPVTNQAAFCLLSALLLSLISSTSVAHAGLQCATPGILISCRCKCAALPFIPPVSYTAPLLLLGDRVMWLRLILGKNGCERHVEAYVGS